MVKSALLVVPIIMVVFKFVLVEHGDQYVKTNGIMLKLVLFADK